MDQKQSKTLYDANAGEIFGKEFLSGFARGLGGFVVTLLSWVVIYFIIIKLIMPQLTSTINQLSGILKVLPTTKGTGPTFQLPENILKQFEQLQK